VYTVQCIQLKRSVCKF